MKEIIVLFEKTLSLLNQQKKQNNHILLRIKTFVTIKNYATI